MEVYNEYRNAEFYDGDKEVKVEFVIEIDTCKGVICDGIYYMKILPNGDDYVNICASPNGIEYNRTLKVVKPCYPVYQCTMH